MSSARRGVATAGILGVALCLGSGGVGLDASSRPYTPLSVSVARAEVVAAIRVVSVPRPSDPGQGPARLDGVLVRAFKGSPPEARLTVALEPFERELLYGLSPGGEYVLFLEGSAAGGYRLADATFLTHSEAVAGRLADMVPLVPAWSDPVDGLQALIVPDHEPRFAESWDPFRYRSGEPIILWMGYRNASTGPIVLRYRDWPLASHTHVRLDVRREGGESVAPIPHPHVSQAQIRAFFSQNAHRFDMPLRPGESFFLYVDRINSAEAGWGFKERLDFRYYPMATPGEYRISAEGRFFHAGPSITTRPLSVWVQ